jgi:IS30 family transposase
MQPKGLHKNIYRLYSLSKELELTEKYEKLYRDKINLYEQCRDEDMSPSLRQELGVVSKATYHRMKKVLKDISRGIAPPSKRPKKLRKPMWTKADSDLVLKIRTENPTYGKEKICAILQRDHDFKFCATIVGKILKKLKEKGLIEESPSAWKTKKVRNFGNSYASPVKYLAYSQMEIGEYVQIDHMSVTINGIAVKYFQAWDRHSKYICGQVYTNATSACAAKFLEEAVAKCPFKIISVQTDGGSEFMGKFEEKCEELQIKLYILPPRRPDLNGGVERANRTFREEFFDRKDILANNIAELRQELEQVIEKYNKFRPHHMLKNLTPCEYLGLLRIFKESLKMPFSILKIKMICFCDYWFSGIFKIQEHYRYLMRKQKIKRKLKKLGTQEASIQLQTKVAVEKAVDNS